MTAKDYPITPGYDFGGTLPPYSKTNPHLGRDRGCPLNTPVVVVNTEIGLAGETGGASGVHTHAAKWKPGNFGGGIYVAKYDATYFDPSDVFDTPGTVSEAGFNAVAGNYVRWQNGDGFTREIFHMNSLNINVGDIIGNMEKKFDEADRNNVNIYIHGKDVGNYKGAVGMNYHDAMYDGIFLTPEFKGQQLVNEGDVPALNACTGRTDGHLWVDHTWKETCELFIFPNVNVEYVETKVFVKKG